MSRLVADTLMDEAKRYFFTNQAGEKIEPQKVLREAMDKVWSRSSEEEKGNITSLIERIAETIHQSYTVEMKDRRKGEV